MLAVSIKVWRLVKREGEDSVKTLKVAPGGVETSVFQNTVFPESASVDFPYLYFCQKEVRKDDITLLILHAARNWWKSQRSLFILLSSTLRQILNTPWARPLWVSICSELVSICWNETCLFRFFHQHLTDCTDGEPIALFVEWCDIISRNDAL